MSRSYPSQPLVGVGVIVWEQSRRRVLLVRRGRPPYEGRWSIPGGAVELGETLAEAAAREVREECAVTIGPCEVLTAVDLIERDDQGAVRYHYALVELLAPWAGGEPRAGDDAAEVAWAGRDDLAALDLWDETRRVLELAFDWLAKGPSTIR